MNDVLRFETEDGHITSERDKSIPVVRKATGQEYADTYVKPLHDVNADPESRTQVKLTYLAAMREAYAELGLTQKEVTKRIREFSEMLQLVVTDNLPGVIDALVLMAQGKHTTSRKKWVMACDIVDENGLPITVLKEDGTPYQPHELVLREEDVTHHSPDTRAAQMLIDLALAMKTKVRGERFQEEEDDATQKVTFTVALNTAKQVTSAEPEPELEE